MSKSVLVIGGCGFLGSHVVDKLLAKNAVVTILDRYPEHFRSKISNVSYIFDEFGNRSVLETIISTGIDVVVHLVSSTIPSTSNGDPIFDIQSNLVETVALLDLCVKYKIKKVVFASSGGTVYGLPKESLITEHHPTDPLCSYGIVKLAIEKYLHLYKNIHNLDYIIARVSNPYGERQKQSAAQGAIPVFTEKILRGLPLEIWGDGSIIRDFIHVSDVANFLADSALLNYYGTYNIGSGEGVNLNQIIRRIETASNLKASVSYRPGRSFDVPKVILDITKVKSETNWRPSITLDEGLYSLCHWMTDYYKL